MKKLIALALLAGLGWWLWKRYQARQAQNVVALMNREQEALQKQGDLKRWVVKEVLPAILPRGNPPLGCFTVSPWNWTTIAQPVDSPSSLADADTEPELDPRFLLN